MEREVLFCGSKFIYIFDPRPLEIVKMLREPYVRCTKSLSMVTHWSSSLLVLEERMMDHATIAIKKDTCMYNNTALYENVYIYYIICGLDV